MTDLMGNAIALNTLAQLAEIKSDRDRWPKDGAKERRERIATAVLAGLNAHGGYFGPDAETLARRAAKMADALIAELDK